MIIRHRISGRIQNKFNYTCNLFFKHKPSLVRDRTGQIEFYFTESVFYWHGHIFSKVIIHPLLNLCFKKSGIIFSMIFIPLSQKCLPSTHFCFNIIPLLADGSYSKDVIFPYRISCNFSRNKSHSFSFAASPMTVINKFCIFNICTHFNSQVSFGKL